MPRGVPALRKFQERAQATQSFEFANPIQEQFALCTARESLFDGGFANGKTTGGIMKLLLLAEQYPGSRWFVARQFYKDLIQTTRKTFLRVIPPNWIDRDVQTETTLFNGTEIVWAHLDEYDVKSLMGLEINGAFLDQVEEIQPEIYEILDARIGRWQKTEWPVPCPAYLWSTSNPNGKDWVYFRFHPDCKPPEYREYFFGQTSINKVALDRYAPGYYAALMRKSPSWRKRWMEGSRDIWEGQIFQEFNRRVHTYDPSQFDPYKAIPGGVSWAWMDYGLTKPTTLLISYTVPNGELFITREYGAAERLIHDHAVNIKSIVAENPARVHGIYADPSMFAESTRDRKVLTTSIAQEYRKEGIYLLKADNQEESSIEILHEMFNTGQVPSLISRRREVQLGLAGSEPKGPMLRISQDCVNLIKEIESQRWAEERNPLTGEREFIGKRLDTVRDDYFDGLRYFANSRAHRVSRVRPQPKLPGYGWNVGQPQPARV